MNLRHLFVAGAVLSLRCIILSGDAVARELTFEDRVKAQEAIERVYYSHQIGATKPFEEAVPRGVLERKVRTYLRQSVALERFWNTPVTAEALRSEIERIAANTRFPERLRDVYQALGGDAFVFQECYVRPFLVDRLSRSFFSSDDRIHADRKKEAEDLHERLLSGTISVLDEHPYRTLVEVAVVEEKVTDGDGFNRRVPGEIVRVEMDLDEYHRWRVHAPPEVGTIGAVSEEHDAFLIRVILAEGTEDARAAVYVIRKLGWDDWWATSQDQFDEMLAVGGATDLIEALSSSPSSPLENLGQPGVVAPCGSPDDVWQNGILDDVPDGRITQAVWTGSLMLFWGGRDDRSFFRDGWRYDPLSDTWTPTSKTGAPAARIGHAAVWTGTLMVVWGGFDGSLYLNTGGRYDPASDTWAPTSTANAPLARPGSGNSVWTGRYLVLWGGGRDGFVLNTGGRYDPVSDSWTATSMINVPAARWLHSVIWTGSSVVVWGGLSATSFLNSGGRYDPSTDTWTATATIGAPLGRYGHSVVWTGNLMLVWGGFNSGPLATGGRYDPASNTWTPISTIGAPSARSFHTAVWTGSLMIVWGGRSSGSDYLGTGGRYDPISNTWSPTSTISSPLGRSDHVAVWTGSLMIVWGGFQETLLYLNTGGRYDPLTDTWTPTSTGTAPGPRRFHSAVWTGSLMIVWGGYPGAAPYRLDTGGRYDPVSDAWSPTSMTGAPEARYYHSAVWTGSLMVVWGGLGFNTGGRYDPVSDTWMPTSTTGAPVGRSNHSAVWTGSRMIVWGGQGADWLRSGGQYDPIGDSWTTTSEVNAPEERYYHTAVWTGSLMIVWGGRGGIYLNTGGRYDPIEDTWTPTSMANAPSRRILHTAIWTGSRMIVWGGTGDLTGVNTGAQYDPRHDSWVSTSMINVPASRLGHTAVWTGSFMVVWGGGGGGGAGEDFNTGGRYDPVSDGWMPTSTIDAPTGRFAHTAVWTGGHMILWGGGTAKASGGQYAVTDASDRDMDGFRFCDGDCDDSNFNIHPGASETCDGVDESCNGLVDEGFDVGDNCEVMVDECHQVVGVWECRSDGTGNQCEGLTRFHDTTPPVLACPEEVTAECPAQPNLGNAIVTDACDLNPMVVDDAPDVIQLGTTVVTWTATDGSGNSAWCQQSVRVYDTIPPTLTVMSDPPVLWPPNHEMVPVHVGWRLQDLCDPQASVALISATSSEPDDAPGKGDGNTAGDIAGADLGTPDADVELRAERDGLGPGRVYELAYRAVDGSGNTTPAFTIVTVPHDQRSGLEPVLMRLEPDSSTRMVLIHWAGMLESVGYDVISGDLSKVKVVNQVLSLGTVKVLGRGTTETSVSEEPAGAIPPPGAALFYLIQPRTERGGMGYGTESAPWPRVPESCDGGCP